MPKKIAAATDSNDGPRLGALLRLSYQLCAQELALWLERSGHPEVQPAHCAVVQALWEQPDGARLTDLARSARITKQSMSALVDHLQRKGYVERIDDPADGRASRLHLTHRGRSFGRGARAFSDELETRWAERVGARRLAELRRTLRLLNEAF